MPKTKKAEEKIKKIISQLKRFDAASDVDHQQTEKMMATLVGIGKPAAPFLIELFNNHDSWMSCAFAAQALGKIGDRRAIEPLADALEDARLGDDASEALKQFGPGCIKAVIQRIEHRIANPISDESGIADLTSNALTVLGDIRCKQASAFLNRLLDDYIAAMPDESFNAATHEWKYRNVDFFHLLDCMVRQQDHSAIPHIEKARDCFSEAYTDYKICQIAIGRIKAGKVEGYLPMEALEITMPSGLIMDALCGGNGNWKDPFDDLYGEYFDEDNEDG